MLKIFDFDNPIYIFFERVADIVLLNLVWLACCVPVITIGASTTAMLSVAFAMARGERVSIFKEFFAAFRSNFKQSTLIFLIVSAIGGLLWLDLLFWSARSSQLAQIFQIVTVGLLIPYLFLLIYVFSVQAFFENSLKNTLKNSLLMAFAHPIASLQLALLLVFMVAINTTIVIVNFVTLICGGAFVAYIAAKIQLGIFDRYVTKDMGK